MNEEKIRPQILETPYKIQDVCPTRKFKTPEDTLRRIQKKIAFAERKTVLSSDSDKTAGSTKNKSLSEETSSSSSKENVDLWVHEFRKRYKAENFKNGYPKTEWFTASDIFRQVAYVYSNEMTTKDSCVFKTRKL